MSVVLTDSQRLLQQLVAAESALGRADARGDSACLRPQQAHAVVAQFAGLPGLAAALDANARLLAWAGSLPEVFPSSLFGAHDAAAEGTMLERGSEFLHGAAAVARADADTIRDGLESVCRDRCGHFAHDFGFDGMRGRIDAVPAHWESGAGALALVRRVSAAPVQPIAAVVRGHSLQAAHLGRVRRVCSTLVHDLGNAITPVNLYCDLLRKLSPSELSERGPEYLEIVADAVQEMDATLARMHAFYVTDSAATARSAVDLNAVVRAALAELEGRERLDGIEVVTDLDAGLRPVRGQYADLRDAILALLANAIEAMPDGGRVDVGSGVEAASTPARACLSVTDTGIGMDAETLAACLDPFFTTKVGGVRGLGLSTAHGAMLRAGGDIELESRPGQGTRARLLLPLAGPAHAPVVAHVERSRPAVERARRILVVDDDLSVLRTLAQLLAADGHHVSTAHGGPAGLEALAQAHAKGERFDVLLTDLGMPDVDGREVAATAKRLAPECRVVILTGSGEAMIEAPTSWSDCVLTKPPQRADLRAAVEAGDPRSE